MAPATSNTLLNSFYTLYDFLPPSNPPAPSYPPPIPFPPPPPIPDDPPEEDAPRRTLTKKKTRSMVSLRSLGRKHRPKNLDTVAVSTAAPHGRKPSSSTLESVGNKSRPMSGGPYSNGKVDKPPSFNDWSVVKLVEQYDPDDLLSVSQPYAYVADYMVEVTLSASLSEEMAKYEAKLRAEDLPMSTPATPATPASPATGDLQSPGMSARDVRRKSRRLGWFEKLRDGIMKGEDIGWYVVVCGDEERASPSVDPSSGRPSTSIESDDTERRPRSSGLKGFFGKKKPFPDE